MSTSHVECRTCGAAIDVALDTSDKQSPCRVCGSSLRNINAAVMESAFTRDGLGVKIKRAGERKPYVENRGLPSFSYRFQKLVSRQVLIDRDNDRYFEKVTDYETGEVLHECNEPLSQHQGAWFCKAEARSRKWLTGRYIRPPSASAERRR